jgi:hypothetical protein
MVLFMAYLDGMLKMFFQVDMGHHNLGISYSRLNFGQAPYFVKYFFHPNPKKHLVNIIEIEYRELKKSINVFLIFIVTNLQIFKFKSFKISKRQIY